MLNSLKTAIRRTIRYGKGYGVDYSLTEIEKRLISPMLFSKKEILIVTQNMGVSKYSSTNKYVVSKKRKAVSLAILLGRKFCNILLIGVTGSVAAGYPGKNDDIDLMIVTKRDSLWVTRLLLRIFIVINKIPHRRYGKREKSDEFCFNLWLDEDSLRLPNSRRCLKNAMDLILMIPVVNKYYTYEKFIESNSWVEKFVANGYQKVRTGKKLLVFKKVTVGWVCKMINHFVFRLQYWYMKTKIGDGLVDLKRAYFHPKRG